MLSIRNMTKHMSKSPLITSGIPWEDRISETQSFFGNWQNTFSVRKRSFDRLPILLKQSTFPHFNSGQLQVGGLEDVIFRNSVPFPKLCSCYYMSQDPILPLAELHKHLHRSYFPSLQFFSPSFKKTLSKLVKFHHSSLSDFTDGGGPFQEIFHPNLGFHNDPSRLSHIFSDGC